MRTTPQRYTPPIGAVSYPTYSSEIELGAMATDRPVLVPRGDYPETVFRAFDSEQYARAFCERGQLRLGNLQTYIHIEDDVRRDADEGRAEYVVPGPVTQFIFSSDNEDVEVVCGPGLMRHHAEMGNPRYVLSCFTDRADLDHLRDRFGRWVVRLNDPRRLAQDLCDFFLHHPVNVLGGVDGCYVEYTQGAEFECDLEPDQAMRLTYAQKPTAFAAENEFRYVVLIGDKPTERFNDPYLEVDLGGPIEYAEICSS